MQAAQYKPDWNLGPGSEKPRPGYMAATVAFLGSDSIRSVAPNDNFGMENYSSVSGIKRLISIRLSSTFATLDKLVPLWRE